MYKYITLNGDVYVRQERRAPKLLLSPFAIVTYASALAFSLYRYIHRKALL